MAAFLEFAFLQRALVAGVFIAVACAMLGVFLVLRKDAMVGHGMSHIAFAGVAAGLFLNMMPLAAALLVAVSSSFIISRLKEKAGLYGDTILGIFSSLGFALGILLATMAGKFNVDLFAYLFGDILIIEPLEVWLSIGMALGVAATVLVLYPRLLFATFDRESARASGISVSRLDDVLTVMTAVAIVLGMKVVGVLLVAALIVIPAATGLQAASSFRSAMLFSTIASVVSVVLGLFASLAFNVPASAAIVIVGFLLFLMALVFKPLRKNFRT